MNKKVSNVNFVYKQFSGILQEARKKAYKAVNFVMIEAYWNIGKRIVEEEQKGKQKAEYGIYLIETLSDRLTKEFGKGFSRQNLWYMRQFYMTFVILHALRGESKTSKIKIDYPVRDQLTWTHYRLIMQVENKSAKEFYIKESIENNWSTKELERERNRIELK
jgi:predicted nuclease of restriction endonuclease-like (RecB) superfamily